jgi:hypothetical protein
MTVRAGPGVGAGRLLGATLNTAHPGRVARLCTSVTNNGGEDRTKERCGEQT